jgi:hypothetical protein
MAADDALFDPEATPTNDPKPDGTPAPAPDVGKAVNDALAPFQQTIQNLAEQVQALSQAKETQPDNQPNGLDGGDDATRLLTDPNKVIDERVAEAIKSRVDPAVRVILGDRGTDLLEAHRTEIDENFGEGAWDELVKPELEGAIKDLPAEVQASKGHMRILVNAIKGAKLDEFRERLDKRDKEDTSVRRGAPPRMLGEGRPRPREPELAADLKEIMADWERATGEKPNPKDWEEGKGNTEDDWPREMFVGKEATK